MKTNYDLLPMGDRILVLRDKAEEKIGSIVLAPQAMEKPLEGTVVAHGTDEKFHTRIGDKVLFTAWTGQKLPVDEAEGDLLVMREAELLAVRRVSVAVSGSRNGVQPKASQAPAR